MGAGSFGAGTPGRAGAWWGGIPCPGGAFTSSTDDPSSSWGAFIGADLVAGSGGGMFGGPLFGGSPRPSKVAVGPVPVGGEPGGLGGRSLPWSACLGSCDKDDLGSGGGAHIRITIVPVAFHCGGGALQGAIPSCAGGALMMPADMSSSDGKSTGKGAFV